MTEYAQDLWARAIKALDAARRETAFDSDLAASRAYFAAFYAVSALFAAEGTAFTKHSAVETAVHRDLVKTNRWPKALGAAYSSLRLSRATGDYGGAEHVLPQDAAEAVASAEQVVKSVSRERPDLFPIPE